MARLDFREKSIIEPRPSVLDTFSREREGSVIWIHGESFSKLIVLLDTEKRRGKMERKQFVQFMKWIFILHIASVFIRRRAVGAQKVNRKNRREPIRAER